MEKPTEKQPIDELFARKLADMVLPPSTDGFERLQARMDKSLPKTRTEFWANQTIHRYAAIAACLLLVSSMGWLYWLSNTKTAVRGPQVAVHRTSSLHPERSNASSSPTKTSVSADSAVTNQENKQGLAAIQNSSENTKENDQSATQLTKVTRPSSQPVHLVGNQADWAEVKPRKSDEEQKLVATNTINQPIPGQITGNTIVAKPTPIVERVLVVTIAEPELLAVTRDGDKGAVEEKSLVSTINKAEKESKPGNLWRQVKRIKQGDVFAHQGSATNDDQGLLERAYSGVKHSFDKDKSVKQ